MKRTSLRLISVALVLVLAVFSLTGCTFFENIGNAFLGIFNGEPVRSAEATFDLEEAINEITTSTIRSEVTIYTKYYNQTKWGEVTDYAIAQGSGTVIMRSTASSLCYVLTNAHCVEDMTEYAYKSITVTSYCGNEYKNAEVHYGSINEAYDLAIMQFYCEDMDVQPLALADENPGIGDTVISLGSPYAQTNAITVGKAASYYNGELIEVEALYHTALVGSGGSGGALLNTDLEMCGVNFAADTSEEDFTNGSAIPIESVRAYLSEFSIFKLIL